MSIQGDSIGHRFENFLLERFPELVFTGTDSSVPDFHHPNLDFWIEAKVGNKRWGPRPHEKQSEDFREFDSVVYALGYHNLDSALKRVTQKTEKRRQTYLEKHMEIVQVCFMTDSMLRLLLEKETKESEKSRKGHLTRNNFYCQVKNGILNNLFERREFERDGRKVEPESYYGFSYSDYKWVTHYDNAGLYWRAMLDPREDRAFIGYMKGKGVLGRN
jgi:hypothetical protein